MFSRIFVYLRHKLFYHAKLSKIALLAPLVLVAAACAAGPQIRDSYNAAHPVLPPAGRWAAAYTKEFAEKYNLPKENISAKLSPGVDYMEMTTETFGPNKAMGCFVNFLIKQPNDLPFYPAKEKWDDPFTEFNQSRQLTRLLPLPHPQDIQRVNGYFFGSLDSYEDGHGFGGTTLAFYSPSYVKGYDYVTADASCHRAVLYVEWKDIFAIYYYRASLWGKYERKFGDADTPGRPSKEQARKSLVFIHIPPSLTHAIFQGI